jgi:hypothetical protein
MINTIFEDEDDDENDAYKIVIPTRFRPGQSKIPGGNT